MIKISKNKFLTERPILMRDRKGEESGSDLPLHSGVLALPEFRIRTRNQEAIPASAGIAVRQVRV
jgi:hypothetical protein